MTQRNYRPLLATAGTALGITLLIGGKSLTSSPVAPSASSVVIPATATGSVTGPLINTRYGPVQVRVTVANGKVTDATTTQLPSGGKSGSISDYAGPVLNREALAAQGAAIQAVSGATYTSDGYASSLQAALDQIVAAQTSPHASPTPTG
jgi:uncharacterized protein with FMN-binding domain